MISKEEIIEDIIMVRGKIGKIPSQMDYVKHGSIGKTTIYRRFGRWSAALHEAFDDYHEDYGTGWVFKKCAYPPCHNEVFTNPDKEKHCSVACANRNKPKRKRKPRHCKNCRIELFSNRTYCEKCHEDIVCSYNKKTIAEVCEHTKGKRAGVYSYIRQMARKKMNSSDIEKKCLSCNYDKHVETCHIRDISDFPKKTKVEEVNSMKNLCYLCRNCHWELDNGHLSLSDFYI